jgi:hypothetical protein
MKQFQPDYEYQFWFWKHKFGMVMEMLSLLIAYDLSDVEVEGMILSLPGTDHEAVSKWIGGLHYGQTDVMYIKFALDRENSDIVHCFIATHAELSERIEFVDKLQCTYQWFQK